MELIKNQLAAIVGQENIIDKQEDLVPYAKGNIGFIADRFPLMALRPGTAEEIKDVLRVAAMNKIPVTPWSSVLNGHGASIPSIPGITIDMTRFKTIHMVDDAHRNAIVDAGVTFGELQKAAKAKGLRVMAPVDLPSECSVISSYMEMAPLFGWPKYGTEFVLTLDLMLPSGVLQKTGSSSWPALNEKPYVPISTVPAFMDKIWFGSQGTFGIATKGVVKLKTDYADKEVLFIPFNSIGESVPAIKEISRLECAVEFFVANGAYLSGLLTDDGDRYEELKGKLPAATAVLTLRGEKERVEYQLADLEDLGLKMGFDVLRELPGEPDAPGKLLEELDEPKGYTRFERIKGSYHVIPFMCMAMQLPMFDFVTGQIIQGFKQNKGDIGEMLLPVEPSRFHYQYSLLSDPSQPQIHMMNKKLFEVLGNTLIMMGGFFSRPYGEWSTKVYEKANMYRELLKEFKAVVDPDGIMNPGKLCL